MKNIFKTLLIILSILLISCKKEEHVSIQGKIINIVTKQPVSDVRVKVCDGLRWVGGDTEDGNCQLTYTDKDGNFATDIESEKAHLYFYKEGYEYVSPDFVGVTSLSVGKHTNKVYEIDPKCEFVPTYISKESPSKEHILTVDVGQKYRSNIFFYSDNRRFIGKSPFVSDFFGYLTFVGDMHVVYRLRFDRDGQNQEIIDSVFLKQGEIFRDTIYY